MAYCLTSSNKGLKGSGLKVGETVLVVGTKVVPIKANDPYLQRILFFCIRVDEKGNHQVPDSKEGDESNGYKQFLIDPRCLTMLNEDKQKFFKSELDRQYDSSN